MNPNPPCPGDTPLFTYEPLQDPKNDIRLLRISAVADDHIECSLEHVSLHSEPKYFALSYCWGSASQSEPIQVNGSKLSVTVNLFGALEPIYRYFEREERGECYIWIDAVCIDQKNEAEKSRQVQEMGRIYQNAEVVLVWLGPEANDSKRAMLVLKGVSILDRHSTFQVFVSGNHCDDDVAQQNLKHLESDLTAVATELGSDFGVLCKSVGAFHELFVVLRAYKTTNFNMSEILQTLTLREDLFPQTDPFWTASLNLVDNDWFRRVWTYQEILLAKRAIVLCGDDDVDWNTFHFCRNIILSPSCRDVLFDLQHRSPAEYQHYLNCCIGAAFDGDLTARKKTFPNLLAAIGSRDAKNPRDHVYGIFGLVGDEIHSQFQVDYKLSVSDVYINALKAPIEQARGVEFWELLMQRHAEFSHPDPSGDDNLPSWCPDFRLKNHMRFYSFDLSHEGLASFKPSLSSEANQLLQRSAKLSVRQDTKIMAISGLRLNVIKEATVTALNTGEGWSKRYKFANRDVCSNIIRFFKGDDELSHSVRLTLEVELHPGHRDLFKLVFGMNSLQWLREMHSFCSAIREECNSQEQLLDLLLYGSNFDKRYKVNLEDLTTFCEQVHLQGIETLEEAAQKLDIAKSRCWVIWSNMNNFLMTQSNRYFLRTASDRIGLAFKNVQSGDQICFIPGGRYLHVLSSDCSRYIGRTLVDGCMGTDNFLAYFEEWKSKPETFYLK